MDVYNVCMYVMSYSQYSFFTDECECNNALCSRQFETEAVSLDMSNIGMIIGTVDSCSYGSAYGERFLTTFCC